MIDRQNAMKDAVYPANGDRFHFADAVVERARRLGHCFCLGLDPHLSMIPSAFRCGDMKPNATATIRSIEDFLVAVVDQAVDRVVAFKPQSAMYEQLGSVGIALLERIVAYAHSRECLVVLDAKRGDIAATADAYAQAYLADDSPNPVDAMTVNPYMGLDTLEPYLKFSHTGGKGVFVVLRTSNPGSGAFQDLDVCGTPVYAVIANALRPLTEKLCDGSTGWSSLGVVVGATYPEEAIRIRALLPKALFLLPGYGYQKGDVARITAALMPGAHKLEGGLISSSRATLFPADAAATSSFSEWKLAFSGQLSRHIEAVSESLWN
jgi:orotidine-5'-phosphate decarboxylase